MAVSGSYNVTMKTPMGERPATLNLAEDGSGLTGTFASERGSTELLEPVATGDEVKFSMMFNGAMGEMKLDFEGKIDGDSIGGTVQFGSFGSGTWTGTRA